MTTNAAVIKVQLRCTELLKDCVREVAKKRNQTLSAFTRSRWLADAEVQELFRQRLNGIDKQRKSNRRRKKKGVRR